MTDLAAWLAQILDEDTARAGSPLYCASPWPSAHQILAWIAADRQILAWCVEREQIWVGTIGSNPDLPVPEDFTPGHFTNPAGSTVLRLLALPYADRPGYREEWRP